MLPTLKEGDMVFFKKYIKNKSLLKVGQIVIFYHPLKNIRLIKRIKNNDKRPVIKDMSHADIKKLISERNKIYNFSEYKIICENLKKGEIVDKILQKCKKNEIVC